ALWIWPSSPSLTAVAALPSHSGPAAVASAVPSVVGEPWRVTTSGSPEQRGGESTSRYGEEGGQGRTGAHPYPLSAVGTPLPASVPNSCSDSDLSGCTDEHGQEMAGHTPSARVRRSRTLDHRGYWARSVGITWLASPGLASSSLTES